jgi:hypothetical protein
MWTARDIWPWPNVEVTRERDFIALKNHDVIFLSLINQLQAIAI